MGSHPANLFLRFILEIIALISIGIWGWKQTDNWYRFILAIGIPILLAIIWGTFAVPNDPSRSGSAPIVTNGLIRLVIEVSFFTFAIWTLKDLGWTKSSLIMIIVVIFHYIVSYDRVLWLISK
ncbi:YrdB family protein [Psychroserpens sp. AS72]|uniref:YrdB family protein n=1 Tax=Psychroserpens sp. AS72 TaxID=3135775 RepID=UPI00316BD7C9